MIKNILKIVMLASVMVFFGVGVSMADDDDCRHPRDRGHGYYKNRSHHHYRYYEHSRPVYVEHHHYPVVVERHHYREPVRYIAPEPGGFFFGMSASDAGPVFSFGVSGR